jgi:hypothetical protein
MAEEIAEETEFHKFKRHVESNSVVEMVLKAHLIIEDTLMETLKFLLPHPGHVKPETMSFYDKVSLCGALGFISEYEVAALLTFNTLRNDTAHQLDTEISMADIQQVVNCFEPELRANLKHSPHDGNEIAVYLQLIVGILYMQVLYIAVKPMMANIDATDLASKQQAIISVARKYGVELGVDPNH